jgi:hypothetical protein
MSSGSPLRTPPSSSLAVARLADDPADADENAAPTKVGPMSKAFVDQMMFRAQLAESSIAPTSERPTSRPPESFLRTRDGERVDSLESAAKMLAPAKLPVVSDDEGQLPFEGTLLMPQSQSQPAAPPASQRDSAAVQASQPASAALVAAQPTTPAPTTAASVFVTPAPWTSASALVAPGERRDKRLAIEVAVCVGLLALAIAGVVVFLFP